MLVTTRLDWIGWKSPGGRRYRAPYGANKYPLFQNNDNDNLPSYSASTTTKILKVHS